MNTAIIPDVERTVTLVKSAGFDDTISRDNVDHREVLKAIGYLAQWAMHCEGEPCRQCKVRIGLAPDGNIYALYRDKDDNITYEIGAILRSDGTYSFHS